MGFLRLNTETERSRQERRKISDANNASTNNLVVARQTSEKLLENESDGKYETLDP